MNAFEFFDIKFQQVSVELGKDYSLYADGRAKGIHAIIGIMRTFYKYMAIPLLVCEYVSMKVGVSDVPESPIKKKAEESEAAIKTNNVSREHAIEAPTA